MKSRLAIIIVNFRTPGLTVDCLASLESEVAANPGTRVIVVENGSGDDSARQVASAIESRGWGGWCTLVVSEKNWGFAGGNNRGVERVSAEGGTDYFLLLNSDTVVKPGCLSFCLGLMDRDATIGAMSCRLLNPDGTPQNVCRRFPTPMRCLAATFALPWRFPRLFGWAECEDLGWDRNTIAKDVDWLGGAFMLLRGDWVARYKGLDERFFFYGEDIEICHRIHRTGLRCRYDPGATVIHFGGQSSDPTRMAAGKRSVHSWRGRYLVQRFCYGRLAELLLRTQDLINVGLRVAWGRLTGRRSTERHQVMAGELRVLLRNWSKWGEHAA